MSDAASGGAATVVIQLPPHPRPVPPFDADPAAVTAFGEELRTASTQVDDFGGFVPGAARIAGWAGEASTAYHAAIRPQGRQADAMSLALRDVAHRAMRHAEALTRFQREHEDLGTERSRLLDAVDALAADVNGAPVDRAPQLRARAQELAGQVSSFDARVDTWAQQLATEESQMREAFRGAMTLERVEQRWGGAADPADAALARKPGPDATPEQVNAWWESLTSEEQMAVIAASPGSIGNLDGVPAAARDQANRTAMARDVAEWELLEEQGTITLTELRMLENARAAQEALMNAEGEIDPLTFEPVESRLYLYDPGAFGGDGRVALTYGDPDTADHLSVHVPGMTTDMTSAPGNGEDAWAAYAASRSTSSDSVAAMAWIGYDAPDNYFVGGGGLDILQVTTEGLAARGGERLADTMAGLDAIRGDDPHITVVGHSYGSTTVGRGAADHGLSGVDELVLIGSPGAGGDSTAADLGTDPDRVWVGTNSSDPVGYLGDEGWVGGVGTLGNDPSNRDFGGQRFQAEDNERLEGADRSIDQHTSYYEQNSESLFNISQVITGQYDEIELAEERVDPWYWTVDDPEKDRDVTNPDTGSWSP